MKVGFDAAYMNFVNANKQSIKKKKLKKMKSLPSAPEPLREG